MADTTTERLWSLIRQLQGALGGRRFDVQGVVSSAGVVTGDGFSVNKTGTGTYVVTYTTAFAASPVVQTTLGATAGLTGTAVTSPSASGCTVVTFNGAGLANGEFYFSANGS